MSTSGPSIFTLPNVVSLLRLVMVPVFVFLLATQRVGGAMWVFVVAMATDWVDGLLARLLNQRSAVGAVMDPLADKLLLFSAVTALLVLDQLPVWLWGVLFLRDGAMAAWAVRVRRLGQGLPAAPSLAGKGATLALTVTVGLALWKLQAPQSPGGAALPFLSVVSGLLVVVSAIQYMVRFGHWWRAPKKT